MTKTISAKDLRLHFSKIKLELDRGTNFIVIYRSKPIAEIHPLEKENNLNKQKEIFKKWPVLSGGKKFSAVNLIRKDRD